MSQSELIKKTAKLTLNKFGEFSISFSCNVNGRIKKIVINEKQLNELISFLSSNSSIIRSGDTFVLFHNNQQIALTEEQFLYIKSNIREVINIFSKI